MVRNPVINVKKSTEDKSVSCKSTSKVFTPGFRTKVVCGGVVANMIILTNGPNEKELAICEVEVYGKFYELKPAETPLWEARLVVSF